MSIIEKAANKLRENAGVGKQEAMDGSLAGSDKYAGISEKKIVLANAAKQIDTKPAVLTTNKINIDLDKLHDLGLVTPDHGRTQSAEQFRIIKRPLLTKVLDKHSKMTKNANLIMLTSSLAAEGKSFCSVSLAMSIASEMDHRVLLVDADVARPSLPGIFGFSAQKGLLDILSDNSLDVADVLIKTNVEKLTLITAGKRRSHHTTELLASQGMYSLLNELSRRYPDRIVIFDSPPLLLTSEARALAFRMGQIVLVVEAERTAQQTVRTALKQIAFCKDISLIYNKARSFSGDHYYGYYYGLEDDEKVAQQ